MNKPIVNEYNAEALEEIAQEEIKEPWGIETQIDLHDCDPDIIRDADAIKRYVVELCDLIEMKRFGECVVVHFGEDEKVAGYSMIQTMTATQLIETSCITLRTGDISGHFANASNRVYINIFSCKAYNTELTVNFTKDFFKARKVAKATVSNRD